MAIFKTQLALVCIALLLGVKAQPEVSEVQHNDTTSGNPRRMAVEQAQMYNPSYAGSRSAQSSMDEEEEYQQAMREAGISPTSNYQEARIPVASYPFGSNYSPFRASNMYAGRGNDYYSAQPTSTIQRVVVEKPQEETTNQKFTPEVNIVPQTFALTNNPNLEFVATEILPANFQTSNFQTSNFQASNFPVQNQRNVEFVKQQSKTPLSGATIVPLNNLGMLTQNQGQGANPNFFVPAIAITQPNFGAGVNNMFPTRPVFNKQHQQQQMRPVMNNQNNGNLMGANTLTMPVFFAPNMAGMNRMNMPYPSAFNPMIYPSPMFIPNVNPYAPFFPKKTGKNKKKVKSENRDDRDDAEDLFEDDIEESEE